MSKKQCKMSSSRFVKDDHFYKPAQHFRWHMQQLQNMWSQLGAVKKGRIYSLILSNQNCRYQSSKLSILQCYRDHWYGNLLPSEDGCKVENM